MDAFDRAMRDLNQIRDGIREARAARDWLRLAALADAAIALGEAEPDIGIAAWWCHKQAGLAALKVNDKGEAARRFAAALDLVHLGKMQVEHEAKERANLVKRLVRLGCDPVAVAAAGPQMACRKLIAPHAAAAPPAPHATSGRRRSSAIPLALVVVVILATLCACGILSGITAASRATSGAKLERHRAATP